MAAGAFDPKAFSGIVPVFPLPNVVLFPGMFLPLHVFEPRYREMTADALQGERLIAMALLKPGWQQDYAGSPPIHEVVGVGKIVEDARLEDGRYNLMLFGLARVRVLEEVASGRLYRTARVRILEEQEAAGKEHERRRRALLAIYVQLMRDLGKGSVAVPPEDVPLGMLCDLVAALLSFDLPTRQSLLEELDVAARCGLLMKHLQGLLMPGAGDPARPRRPWPQGPSLN